MLRVLYLVWLVLGAVASRFRRTDLEKANAPKPQSVMARRTNVHSLAPVVSMPMRCEDHADCGWAEYCGWGLKGMAMQCQACVGCVDPEDRNFFGKPLAPVTGKCPDCIERANLGKQSGRPEVAKLITPQAVESDTEIEKLRSQKHSLEHELDRVQGAIHDITADQQAKDEALEQHRAKEQALEDEIQALRKNLQTQEAAARMTTSTSTTTVVAHLTPTNHSGPIYHTYNTYNVYNSYNTTHIYNSNGHTFNSWSSCENASQQMPMGQPTNADGSANTFIIPVASPSTHDSPVRMSTQSSAGPVRVFAKTHNKAAQVSLFRLRRRPTGSLPSQPFLSVNNCTEVPLVDY